MSERFRCPRGHEWQTTAGSPTQNQGEPACPICGEGWSVTPALGEQPANQPEPTALVSVPGYEILGELGRGGMGVVYRARQTKLNRLVALKMIIASGHAGTNELRRFQTEAEAIARLQHPNVIQIYEVGEHQGLPFFSLEFCPGGSLDRKLHGRPLPPREAALLVEPLARAMHAAHERGVIHRDLKPQNVLLAEGDVPKITDFGLAKQIDAADQTATGAAVGTPSYMAPEQASGRSKEAGPPCDVYALGAILYECLTGRPPFRAATPLDTMLQVLRNDPVPPAKLQPTVPRDLETICLKCLQKKPHKRYASARDLADDLRRWLDGRPILARRTSLPERAVKWARRRPAAAALIGAPLLMLVGLFVGLAWYARQQRQQEAVVLVEKLTSAEVGAVPGLIERLGPLRPWADPLLRQLAAEAGPESRERLHAALALLPSDPSQADFLVARLSTAGPDELLVIRDALRPHAARVADPLWQMLLAEGDSARRFRAACVLASLTTSDQRWKSLGPSIAGWLVAENPLLVGRWSEALRPIGPVLLDPLIQIVRDEQPAALRDLAVNLLADHAANRPEVLVGLAVDVEPRHFARLFQVLRNHRELASRLLRAVLATPLPTLADQRDALARRQATAAVALTLLGQPEAAWKLLPHSSDPSRRTYLTFALGRFGTASQVLIERLKTEQDASARVALILALGEYTAEQLPPKQQQEVVALLLRWYRVDPHPGVHSAIDWLLRHDRLGPMPRKLNWGQSAALARIDQELAGKPAGPRRWLVTVEGHTLALIPDQPTFWMGSPDDEPDRQKNIESPSHQRRIPRIFAIATKEVTIEQFERYLRDTRAQPLSYAQHYSPDRSGPVIGISWYHAAQYCNWLSKKAGLPESEWCYPANSTGEGMKLSEDFLKRKGFRLPTEAEWEYACRAGASTPRFYGYSPVLLDEYAWYYRNSEDRAWPVGQLRPNDLGLFDVYGSVLEWCQDRLRAYPSSPEQPQDDLPGPFDLSVPDSQLFSRILRGGSFGSRPRTLRSAARLRDRPGTRFDSVGFRVARTLD